MTLLESSPTSLSLRM